MKSIRRLFYIWFAALVALVCLYTLRMIQEDKVIASYENAIHSNDSIFQLSNMARELSSHLENYFTYYDQGSLELIHSSARDFEQALSQYNPDAECIDSLFYYRTIQNILGYILDIVDQGNDLEHSYQKYYNPQLGLRVYGEHFVLQLEKFTFSVVRDNMIEGEKLLRNNRAAVHTLNLAAIVVLISLGALIVVTGDRMRHDIQAISRQAIMLSNGNWEIENLPDSRYAEINHVIQAFNAMKQNTIANLRLQQEKAELEQNYSGEKIRNLEKDHLLREAKLKALQMQINPHFLFNTFNMISRSALLDKKDTTIFLIESISSIMRYTMSGGNEACLKDELAYLQSYINIQRTRFQDTMDFIVDVDVSKNMLTLPVPPLIIQPIIENAVIHGAKDIRHRARVAVTVRESEDRITISVTDNGKGMPGDQLEQLRNTIRSPQLNGIGLSNVAGRLRLFNQTEDGLIIHSEAGMGTSVKITLLTHRRTPPRDPMQWNSLAE